jgi:hypothetical protein
MVLRTAKATIYGPNKITIIEIPLAPNGWSFTSKGRVSRKLWKYLSSASSYQIFRGRKSCRA